MGQRDRIRELPADIRDQILEFLPIEQAARMAILSTIWRDMWFSLRELNFDHTFFDQIQRKYSHVHNDIWMSAAVYIISKVLNQHNGLIRTFVIDFKNIDINRNMLSNTLRSRSFDLDQLFLSVTRKGVEEINFSLLPKDGYRLPNYIFSCPTLRRLHLCGVSVEPISARCTLPNVNSLCFDNVDFIGGDLTIDVPMLENLSFHCIDMTNFNITAKKLYSLAIKDCSFDQLPVNFDLSSLRTLDLDSNALNKVFVNGFTRGGLQLQPLNVEHLILNMTGDNSSAFIHLLRICPKLFKLDIILSFLNDYPKLSEEFYTVAQGHKILNTLKLINFVACLGHVLFIKRLLARFPALEKVVIIRSCQCCYPKTFEICKDKLLRFCCASKKAKVVIFDK